MSYGFGDVRGMIVGGSGHYTVFVVCSNCHVEGRKSLPKGRRAEAMECPNCGCRALHIRDRPRLLDAG